MKLDLQKATHGIAILVDDSLWLSDALPRLYWRHIDNTAWIESAGELVERLPSADESHIESTFRFADIAELQLKFHRLDETTWEATSTLRSVAVVPIELARCHLLHGHRETSFGLLVPTPHVHASRWCAPEPQVGPVKTEMEECWHSMGVTWPRMADPIHEQVNWALSVDTGILTTAWDQPGLHFGFTFPPSAFGEIGMETMAEKPRVFVGLALDGIRFGSGENRTLDGLRIRAGDWQESMQLWAKACATGAGLDTVRPPLAGYCSWYQFFDKVQASDIERASREFADWTAPPGGRTIQIDDGFQIMPGDWRPNSRFEKIWKELPVRIESDGSIPGLWLAPHAIFHRHPVCTEHPEWLQRLPDGTPAISFSNWAWCADPNLRSEKEPTYFLDPDHPGARQFMFDIVADAVRAGWKYLKLDFTYAVSTARKPWNPSRTRMETLRDMYQLFREAAGPQTILCACIGEMGRYALGFVDTARLGGDIGTNWKAISQNLPDLLVRLSTNGRWWNADPDVFVMRKENSATNSDEAWCLTGTIGMIGGVFITSDFASQWDAEAVQLVRNFWNAQGPTTPSHFRVAYSPTGIPQAIRLSYQAPERHRVLLYNWKDTQTPVRVKLSALGFSPAQTLKIEPVSAQVNFKLDDVELSTCDMPPHSLLIACLHESST